MIRERLGRRPFSLVFRCKYPSHADDYEPRLIGSRQIRDLQISVSQPFGEAFQSFVQAIGSLGVALYFSWSLTLVVVCSVPLIYIVMAFLSRLLSKSAHEQSDKLQEALKYVTNAITSIESVKCFNGERFELQRYSNAIARAGRLYHRQANFRSMQLGFMQFTTLSIFVQGFWYGSHLVISGQRNAGQIVTTFWAAMMAVQGITGFLPQFIVLQKGKVAGARLRSLMAQISEADSATEVGGDEKPERCIGDLQLQKVCNFACPDYHSTDSIGVLCIPIPTRTDCHTRSFDGVPSWANHICDWKKWVREEHTGPAPCAILPTRLWSNPPRWSAS